MKKFLLTFLAVAMLATILPACSNELPEDDFTRSGGVIQTSAEDFKISENEALTLADKVTGNNSTRDAYSEVSITPVYAEPELTRASDVTFQLDTLAYVINYADNKGFSIISKDNRINPVLAYSTTGNFSLNNEISKEQFIDRLNGYMKIKCVGNKKYDDSNVADACYIVNNMVTVSIGQGNPFDKYVIKEHPNCPVGCVAVASALVMMHSKKYLSYGRWRYHFSDIRKYLAQGLILHPSFPITNSGESELSPQADFVAEGVVNGYLQAVDYTAELLYEIGKDVDMNYAVGGSGANSYNAYLLIKKLGFNVVTGFETMNLKTVSDYLEDNCIIYMRGSGHAWVVDGVATVLILTLRSNKIYTCIAIGVGMVLVTVISREKFLRQPQAIFPRQTILPLKERLANN